MAAAAAGSRCRAAPGSRPRPKRRRPMLPTGCTRPAPSPVPAPEPLRPSRLLGRAGSAGLRQPAPPAQRCSPARTSLAARRAVHLLLQRLPGVPEAERHASGDALARARFPRRSGPGRIGHRARRDAVLADPALADLFGRKPRRSGDCRDAFATAQGDYAVSGRIDRLAADGAGWRLVDFKTDRASGFDRRRSTRLTSCRWRSTVAS